MKLIDLAQTAAPQSAIEKAMQQARGLVGGLGNADQKAQDPLINSLGRTLNNRYTMLRNVRLEGLELPIPLILVGPSGIQVIYASAEKGIFRAKGETLYEMKRNDEFVVARPNLIIRTLMMAKAVEVYLQNHNLTPPEVSPILFFAHPGIHLDSIRPAIRIVLIDGLEHYASTILQNAVFIEVEEVHNLVEILSAPSMEFANRQTHPSSPGTARKIDPKLSKGLDNFSKQFNFNTKQWLILGGMALLILLILVGFIFFILQTT